MWVGVELVEVVTETSHGTFCCVLVTVQEEIDFPFQPQGITVETHAQVLYEYAVEHDLKEEVEVVAVAFLWLVSHAPQVEVD